MSREKEKEQRFTTREVLEVSYREEGPDLWFEDASIGRSNRINKCMAGDKDYISLSDPRE